MAWFEDLSPCGYFGEEHAADLRAVGWLSHEHSYPTGDVSREFFETLCELLRRPWSPFHFMGFHMCELCQFTGGGSAQLLRRDGTRWRVPAWSLNNLFVPGDGIIYVSPESIVHYIDAHRYRPPDEFMAAVMRCPRMSSAAYFGAIRANGGEFGRRATHVAEEQRRLGPVHG